jgi:hypothetical protein
MATLAQISRERKGQLKQLSLASRKVDAVQEALEREVKRIISRKKAVPETADALRLIELARAVVVAVEAILKILDALSTSWGNT